MAFRTAAATARDLVIGINQFPSNLNPNIDSMAAKSYVLGLTQRPFTTYDQRWELVCMLCTELPTLENGKAVAEDGARRQAGRGADLHDPPECDLGRRHAHHHP